MPKFYKSVILFAIGLLFMVSGYSQISWINDSGIPGEGNFTVSGTGSVSSLDTLGDIAFAKHVSSDGVYYTCNNCTINIEISSQFTIDYPLYLFNSAIYIGKTGIGNVNSTTSLYVEGSLINSRQALYLDGSSSLQLVSSGNFISLQSAPTAFIYYNFQGNANSLAPAGTLQFSGTQNYPLCGYSSTGTIAYSCSQGLANGPSNLTANGFSASIALPIVLVEFTANLVSSNSVVLNWSTQTETNLGYFTVERSADGANWSAVGTVEADGNSQVEYNYTYKDNDPLPGSNYYRLGVTDLDNKSGFTQTQLVENPIHTEFKIFPNPARNYTDVSIGNGQYGTIKLISIYGQVLQQKIVSASNAGITINFYMPNYPAGNYLIEFVGANGSKQNGMLTLMH